MVKATIAELTEHIGGSPTALQARLIHRVARLELYLTMQDARADANGGMLTAHDGKQYLAWVNSLRLAMRDLGLQKRAGKAQTLEQHLAATYGTPA